MILEHEIILLKISNTSKHYFSYGANIFSIRVRHDHKGLVDRNKMQTEPDEDDFDVTVVAYVDGHNPNNIRTVHNSIVPLAYDCVLLHSRRSLGVKSFPIPARSRILLGKDAATAVPVDVALLCYNGHPSPAMMRDRYPSSNTNDLFTAITDLWIDRLSYSTGKSTIARFDIDAIYHQISSLVGASGGPILDDKGNLIGK